MSADKLTFWITRPEGTSAELSQLCIDHGIDVVELPLMNIEPHDDGGTAARQVMDLDQYSHVIFISANAVHFGMALIEQYWPQLPVGITWLAIGAATGKALRAFDIEAEVGDGVMNSEGLLALPTLQSGPDLQRVLVMRGVGGRGFLAEQLRARGARVDYCELYQRTIPDYPEGTVEYLLDDIGVNCWLASSAETLQNGLAMAERDGSEELLKTPVIVPGSRVFDIAKQAGCEHVVAAFNAGSQAVLQALLTLKG